MGLGGFLGMIGSGIAKYGGKIWNGVKNTAAVIGKIAKPVMNVASKVAPFLSKLPEHYGNVRDKVIGVGDKVSQFIDLLPDGKVKDKLRDTYNKGADFLGKVDDFASKTSETVGRIADFVNPYVQKANDWINGNNKPKALPYTPTETGR